MPFSHFYWANPMAFWLLLLVPIVVVFYLRFQRKKWREAFRFSPLSVIEHLERNPSLIKRVFSPFVSLLVMVCLIAAIARPTVVHKVATQSVDVMLVIDISLSMMATDIKPDRITAAKEAAAGFVQSLPDDVRVGLELFAGDNWIVSPPTTDHTQVVAYLDELTKDRLQPQTQIGSAIQAALNVLSPPETDNGGKTDHSKKPAAQKVMIMMSDGDSQAGYPWTVASTHARQQNVVIDTVGIGSSEPTSIFYQGMELPVSFDESTLRQIAENTGGQYYRAFTEKDFRTIYQQVREKSIHYEDRPDDWSWALAALALVFMLLGGLVEALWVRRL